MKTVKLDAWIRWVGALGTALSLVGCNTLPPEEYLSFTPAPASKRIMHHAKPT